MVLIILAALVLCWADLSIAGNTYYVSTTGLDTNDGLDETTAFKTISKAVNTMIAGDTTFVRGGVYNEGLIRFQRTGTQSEPIKLLNYPGEAPIIDFVNGASPTFDRIYIQHASGQTTPIGWITIQGFEIRDGWEGIKFFGLHNSVFRNNWIHNNHNQGILSGSGHHNVFDRNVINENGPIDNCQALQTNLACTQAHGLYLQGNSYTVTNNLFYNNQCQGIQQNGTIPYDPSKHAGPEFAGALDWVVENNVFAYEYACGGMVIWGGLASALVQNNIFYENATYLPPGSSQTYGVRFLSTDAAHPSTIRNNVFYASGSGGTQWLTNGSFVFPVGEGTKYFQSGNSIGTANPAFTNGGSNALPASPDFTLTSSSPAIDFGIATGKAFCGAAPDAGVHEVCPPISATINGDSLDVTFGTIYQPVVPSGIIGWSVSCSGTGCGTPTPSTVSLLSGSGSILRLKVSGITGGSCAAGQTWTVSFSAVSGSVKDSILIGSNSYPYKRSQSVHTFNSLPVTNNCSGTPPPPPSGPFIQYLMDDGSGTNLNDATANNLDGTLTGGSWTDGHTGFGIQLTDAGSDDIAIPYGSGVNPSTQSLTIAFSVFIPAGTETATRYHFGSSVGSSQRLYISRVSGTWRIGIQGSADGAAVSDLSVIPGWNRLCLKVDSAADKATLYRNGVAGTAAGAVKTYTSYTLASNFHAGQLFGSTLARGGGIYDDLTIWQSVVDCASEYAAWENVGSPTGGIFSQVAHRMQLIVVDSGGTPINLGVANNVAQDVVENGAVAIAFQIDCTVASCNPTSFRLRYSTDGTNFNLAVPDIETADGVSFWGNAQQDKLNTGTVSCPLSGALGCTSGSTQLTSAAIPPVNMSQNSSITLRYIVRVGSIAGQSRYFKLYDQNGNALTNYTPSNGARINVVTHMSSGVGF